MLSSFLIVWPNLCDLHKNVGHTCRVHPNGRVTLDSMDISSSQLVCPPHRETTGTLSNYAWSTLLLGFSCSHAKTVLSKYLQHILTYSVSFHLFCMKNVLPSVSFVSVYVQSTVNGFTLTCLGGRRNRGEFNRTYKYLQCFVKVFMPISV